VQRPAADSRLLFWLASIHGVDGMLHPAINDWVSRCSQSKKLVRGYPHCRIVRRINDTMLTDWDPVDYPDFPNDWPPGATSDAGGQASHFWVYPGEHGPVASLRLKNIADGVEDWQLFHMLGTEVLPLPRGIRSKASDLLQRLVTADAEPFLDPGFAHNASSSLKRPLVRARAPALLESVRREAAARVLAAG